MGKRLYSDAIACCIRAISQNSLSDSDKWVLFSNLAHVNFMLGNYRCGRGNQTLLDQC
ncbi:hypothetical protein MA16_Dca008885 [Dendrobium catenatum]|uniref:Uncharacterized protein n=1 Tax=Dendrobium catenatum TaxID=906689 RepID=A0A2I0VUK5_9ASPA|nr:hypothetical protein MA16_Dca008885 [Dendrobium catenatum]